MLEDEQKAISAAARPSILSPSMHASTTSNQLDCDAPAGDQFFSFKATMHDPSLPPCGFYLPCEGEHESTGIRLYKQSESIKKKHEKLREQKEQEEEKRLQRVPVAPPTHFDAIKYQQQLLERARKIDTARRRQQEEAQMKAQGVRFFSRYAKV